MALGGKLSKLLNIYQYARCTVHLTDQRIKSGKIEVKSCTGFFFKGSRCHVRFEVVMAVAVCIYTMAWHLRSQ